ncbi:MAG: FHA domain-containing protein [Polyangiales bacterium]
MIRFRQTQGADSGRELEFDQDLIRIGRMPDSDVNFDPEVDLDASGRHAEIRNEDGRYLLIDTGSRNGTWLNGQRIKHVALEEGDEIEFGRGGPKLEIEAVRSRARRRVARVSDRPGVAPRDPRFDPLAVPVTTATRLEDLAAARAAADDHLQASRRRRPSARRRRSSAFLWGAAGLVLLVAIAVIIRASLQ